MKAQAAVEFMICVIFLVFIIIVFTAYASGKEFERWNADSKMEAEKICWQLASLINTAMYTNGYYAEFQLPMKIDGKEYNVTVTNTTVIVDYEQHSCIYRIAVTEIRFRTKSAPFNLCGGQYYINNTDNKLFIYNRSFVEC
jgi:hypothetical protein